MLCCKSEEQQLIWFRAMKPFISHIKKKSSKGDAPFQNVRGRLLSRDTTNADNPAGIFGTMQRVSSLPPGSRRRRNRRKHRANSDDNLPATKVIDADILQASSHGRQAALMRDDDYDNKKSNSNRVVTWKAVSTFTSLACFACVNVCCYFIRFGDNDDDSSWIPFLALLVLNATCGVMLRHVSTVTTQDDMDASSSGKSLFLAQKEPSVAKLDSMRVMSTEKVFAGTQTSRRANIVDTELLKIEMLHGEQSKEFLTYASSRSQKMGEKKCYEVQPQTYWNVDPSTFKLRIGPDYKRNKQKAPSGPALFDLITMDIFNSELGLKNVGDAFHMPNIPGMFVQLYI